MNNRLNNEEFLREILIKNLDEKEYVYIKSKIINSWEQDNDYVLIFENMSPMCISYMIDKEEVKKEIRIRKLKKILEN